MTYSQIVKEELCSLKFSCDACNYSFVYGMLLFRKQEEENVLFQCDNRKIADLLAQKIVEETGVIVTVLDRPSKNGRKYHNYCLTLEETEDTDVFYQAFGKALEGDPGELVCAKACCGIAFLRGVFLSCGVLVNPAKEYHFEFKIADPMLADYLHRFLETHGITFKRSTRKGNAILYLKGSEPIEEILTYMGAYKSVMQLMDIKIVKEVRNNVNRVTNCETANIGKTVKASMKQIEDIEYLFEKKGKSYLSKDLLEVAEARLRNPEMSLRELVEEIPSGISRSGLNHRLKRLSELAEMLRAEHTAENT